jgi:hypothetical protein
LRYAWRHRRGTNIEIDVRQRTRLVPIQLETDEEGPPYLLCMWSWRSPVPPPRRRAFRAAVRVLANSPLGANVILPRRRSTYLAGMLVPLGDVIPTPDLLWDLVSTGLQTEHGMHAALRAVIDGRAMPGDAAALASLAMKSFPD